MKFNCPLFGDQTKKRSDTKRDMSNGSLSFYNFTGHFMILAFGINSALKDLVSIAVAKGHNSVNNSKDLFTSFRKSLQLIKPDVPVNVDECKFVNDEKTEEILAELFKTDSVLNNKNQSKIIGNKINNAEQNDMFQFIDNAIAHFSKISPEWGDIFNLAIHSIFIRNSSSAGGGSTSNALGVIWVNPKKSWSTSDLSELFIHELGHNIVFYNELVHLQFKDYQKVADSKNFAQSAILKEKRPLDKVIHSIIVSVEVLLARELGLGHPQNPGVHTPTEVLFKSTVKALDSLKDLKNIHELMTENSINIMNHCGNIIKQFK